MALLEATQASKVTPMNSFFSSDRNTDFRDSVTDSLNQLDYKVNLILKYLNIFYEKDTKMAYDISSLVEAVRNEKTVETSLLNLVQGLSQKVAAMAADVMDDATKSQLAALANELNSNAADMATAVAANTPANPGTSPSNGPATNPTPVSDAGATPVANTPATGDTVVPADASTSTGTPAAGTTPPTVTPDVTTPVTPDNNAATTDATNDATGTTSPAAPAVDSSTTPTANS